MKTVITVMVFALMLAFTIPASAILGMPETLEGTIKSISGDTLSILSEKEATQQIVEIQINNETKFEETVNSLDNLQIGDLVKVKYTHEGDEKVALSIVKVMAEEIPGTPEVEVLKHL
jgi:hypothetical protein